MRKENIFNLGDEIILTNPGNCHSAHNEAFQQLGLDNWDKGECPIEGELGTIEGILFDKVGTRDGCLYNFTNLKGKQYIMNCKGMELLNKEEEVLVEDFKVY